MKLTVDPLLVGKCLILLRLVPVDNQAISEGESGASICGAIGELEWLSLTMFLMASYDSSQLNNERARLVSM